MSSGNHALSSWRVRVSFPTLASGTFSRLSINWQEIRSGMSATKGIVTWDYSLASCFNNFLLIFTGYFEAELPDPLFFQIVLVICNMVSSGFIEALGSGVLPTPRQARLAAPILRFGPIPEIKVDHRIVVLRPFPFGNGEGTLR